MRAQRPRMLRFPAMSSLLSLLLSYAYSTSVMLFLTFFNLIPRYLLQNIVNAIRLYWKPKSTKLTLLIDHKDGVSPNQMFNAAEAFLYTRINPDSDRLRVTKTVKEEHISIKFAKWEAIEDSFEGISLNWKYVIEPPKEKANGTGETPEEKYITLEFEKKYKQTIINSYLPWVIKKAKELEKQKKVVKLHNLQFDNSYKSLKKESVNLNHPSTFDTLVMDPKMKKAIIDDLDLFLKRREFYRKVGKAWKRGYLLYGPPGTGKSSLIAAMSNYLKFDIYDLQLSSVDKDSSLKKLMLSTSNRSIIVIKDIDCSIQLPDRKETIPSKHPQVIDCSIQVRDRQGTIPSKRSQVISKPGSQFPLSGLLNFIDGLWSSCGDERIIIFTTNHKERLDPALLRPGRMDVHIHMSYLTMDGFKTLAANYLNIHDHHLRFSEIEELINCTNVTPAEVAEELLKSEDQEVVLEGVVNLLKQKKMEENAEKERIKEEKLISEEKIAKLYI